MKKKYATYSEIKSYWSPFDFLKFDQIKNIWLMKLNLHKDYIIYNLWEIMILLDFYWNHYWSNRAHFQRISFSCSAFMSLFYLFFSVANNTLQFTGLTVVFAAIVQVVYPCYTSGVSSVISLYYRSKLVR